ncbi:hypothetical protein H4S01_002919 [Coemansia sp. RSA 2610]|nr:hypothetical protein IWW54_002947 [Coemansia sp. RSA 2705]KAJ2366049.1 hypothetical protein H4S01_002919 [Coemansia sp. RSA 2610]
MTRNYPRSIFATRTSNAYTLQCFSPTAELPLPPLSSLFAAHAILPPGQQTPICIWEHNQLHTFHVPHPGQLRCTPASVHVEQREMRDWERIIVTNLFGIVRRGIDIDLIEELRTMIVYDKDLDVDALLRLAPRCASYTQGAAERLGISIVVVCVRDEQTGGLFARAFQPLAEFAEAQMPVAAALHVRDPWTENQVFEVTWLSMGKKRCYLVRQHNDAIAPAAA